MAKSTDKTTLAAMLAAQGFTFQGTVMRIEVKERPAAATPTVVVFEFDGDGMLVKLYARDTKA